jgi:hypothetical protein
MIQGQIVLLVHNELGMMYKEVVVSCYFPGRTENNHVTLQFRQIHILIQAPS